jgi:alpha-ribazole phosphatase/probable phosphoglycerate mutase
MCFGDWEGMTMEEVRERFPGELEKRRADLVNYPIPGEGETIAQLSKRIMPCFRSILEDQNGNDILLVAHGAVNRVILSDALGLDLSKMFNFKQDYGCLNIIDYFSDSTLVKLING